MKYCKKPVVIEAVRWSGENHREMFDFLENASNAHITVSGKNFYIDHDKVQGGLIIKTLEGEHLASIGDFIIKGVNGEFYLCKPDIFCKTYEPVDEKEEVDDAGEVVSKLLHFAENSRSKHDVLLASADLHKQQQASIAELEVQLAGKDAIIKRQQDDHAFWMTEEMIVQKQLKAQLATSQRREQAAVEDIARLVASTPDIKCSLVCDGDCLDCIGSATGTPRGYHYRGPQEAGKGDTNE